MDNQLSLNTHTSADATESKIIHINLRLSDRFHLATRTGLIGQITHLDIISAKAKLIVWVQSTFCVIWDIQYVLPVFGNLYKF